MLRAGARPPSEGALRDHATQRQGAVTRQRDQERYDRRRQRPQHGAARALAPQGQLFKFAPEPSVYRQP